MFMESQYLEQKKTFGKEVIISLVAFANTEGGAVIVGVEDDGTPCGLDIGPETLQRYLNEIKVSTYGKLCVADLERDDYVSSIRNRLLAEAFYLMGDIERYGTGFVRIREHLRDYPELSLKLEELGDFFIAELRHDASIAPPIAPPNILLTGLELRMLTLILENPTVSSTDLATSLSMTRDTAKEYLGRLKQKKAVVRERSTRAGRWVVTEGGKQVLGWN